MARWSTSGVSWNWRESARLHRTAQILRARLHGLGGRGGGASAEGHSAEPSAGAGGASSAGGGEASRRGAGGGVSRRGSQSSGSIRLRVADSASLAAGSIRFRGCGLGAVAAVGNLSRKPSCTVGGTREAPPYGRTCRRGGTYCWRIAPTRQLVRVRSPSEERPNAPSLCMRPYASCGRGLRLSAGSVPALRVGALAGAPKRGLRLSAGSRSDGGTIDGAGAGQDQKQCGQLKLEASLSSAPYTKQVGHRPRLELSTPRAGVRGVFRRDRLGGVGKSL